MRGAELSAQFSLQRSCCEGSSFTATIQPSSALMSPPSKAFSRPMLTRAGQGTCALGNQAVSLEETQHGWRGAAEKGWSDMKPTRSSFQQQAAVSQSL